MRRLLSALVVFLSPAVAAAQGSTPPTPSNPLGIPAPPEVKDPMLEPVPPPKRTLASWDEAVGYMRSRSTDLKIALDAVLQAEAATRIAFAAYLPSISANGAFQHQLITKNVVLTGAATNGIPGLLITSTAPTQDVKTGNIQVQQALVNVQNLDQIDISRQSEVQAQLSVDDKKRTLALGLANQIVAVVTAERGAEINRVGLKVALEQAEITKRKQSLGAANGLDVVRAEQNVANARASLVSGDETLREAREALGLAIGVAEETGVPQGVNIDGIAASAMATCKAVPSVDDRPDVAAAHVALDVAKRNLRNVYYQFLPTINAQSTLAATSVPATAFPNPTWNIQATLSIPIFDGGVRYGNLRSARAAQDIAVQQLESLRRQAIIQVEQAQRQLVVAQDEARVAREQRDLAADNDRMTQTAYTAGQGTSLELVTASEAHRQAEITLALQEFGVVKSRILAVLALAECPW
jgi:outer membrane protein TolC